MLEGVKIPIENTSYFSSEKIRDFRTIYRACIRRHRKDDLNIEGEGETGRDR